MYREGGRPRELQKPVSSGCVISHPDWWARAREPEEERSKARRRDRIRRSGDAAPEVGGAALCNMLLRAFSHVWGELKSGSFHPACGHLPVGQCTWAPRRCWLLPRPPEGRHQRRAGEQQAQGQAPPTPTVWAQRPQPQMLPLPPNIKPPKAGVHELCTPLYPRQKFSLSVIVSINIC